MIPGSAVMFFPAAAGAFDPYWSNVVLAMRMDGLTELTGKTVTVGVGMPSIVTGRFGNCLAFANNTSLRVSNSSSFEFGSGDFTIECWYKPANFSKRNVLFYHGAADGIGSSVMLDVEITNAQVEIRFTSSDGSVRTIGNSLNTLIAGNWYHLVGTRFNGQLHVFVNGVMDNVVANTVPGNGIMRASSINYYIGAQGTNGTPGMGGGLLDDLRITKGIARYTTNFTPPTAPFPGA